MASELGTGVDVRREISAADYDAHYYGLTATPKANYRGYGPDSQPHWARPLATWLLAICPEPYLDVGCAYGHLVRELNALANRHGAESVAQGIEWSDYAYEHLVAERVTIRHADARTLDWQDGVFGTVISLDFLEHFEPPDTIRCLREMDRVLRPDGMSVHLIGAHNPAEDVSRHQEDPTHQNHEPLSWYYAAMQELGWVLDNALSTELSHHPAWVLTDWRDRMSVWRKPAQTGVMQAEETAS